MFTCPVCAKEFLSQRSLSGHMRKHRGVRFLCNEESCNLLFSSIGSFNAHRKTHTEELKCNTCELSFPKNSALVRHISSVHDKEKKHYCDVCNKGFFHNVDLKNHKKIHDEEKQYKCKVCDKQFSHVSNLNKHMRLHLNEKPFLCTICDKRFAQSSTLKRHRMSHEEDLKPRCGLCDKKFTRISELKRHLTKIHSFCLVDNNFLKESRKYYCYECGKQFEKKILLTKHKSECQPVTKSLENDHSLEHIDAPPDVSQYKEESQQNVADTENSYIYLEPFRLLAEPKDPSGSNDRNDDNLTTSVDHHYDDHDAYDDDCDEISDTDSFSSSTSTTHSLCTEDDYSNQDVESPREMVKPILSYYKGDGVIVRRETYSSQIQLNSTLDASGKNEPLPSREDLNADVMKKDLIPEVDQYHTNKVKQEFNSAKTIVPLPKDPSDRAACDAKISHAEVMKTIKTIVTNLTNPATVHVKNVDIPNDCIENDYNEEMVDDPSDISDGARLEKDTVPDPVLTDVVKVGTCSVVSDAGKVGTMTSLAVNDAAKARTYSFVCDVCGKGFEKPCFLKCHKGTHSDHLKKFECTVCQARFSWKSCLKTHIAKMHSSQPVQQFTCSLCDKKYTASSSLKDHIKRVHNGEKRFSCGHCGKQFFKQSDLKVHERVHLKIKPYSCNVCDKSFLHISHLHRHSKLHSDKKP